jgi:hypothetical protein
MAELQSENLTDLEFDFLSRLAGSRKPISFSSFRHSEEGDLLGSEVLATLASLRRRRLIQYDYDNYPIGTGLPESYILTKRGKNFVLREKLV